MGTDIELLEINWVMSSSRLVLLPDAHMLMALVLCKFGHFDFKSICLKWFEVCLPQGSKGHFSKDPAEWSWQKNLSSLSMASLPLTSTRFQTQARCCRGQVMYQSVRTMTLLGERSELFQCLPVKSHIASTRRRKKGWLLERRSFQKGPLSRL